VAIKVIDNLIFLWWLKLKPAHFDISNLWDLEKKIFHLHFIKIKVLGRNAGRVASLQSASSGA
jgi:hypothetical protein